MPLGVSVVPHIPLMRHIQLLRHDYTVTVHSEHGLIITVLKMCQVKML